MRFLLLALALALLPAAKTMDDVTALIAQDRLEDAFNLARRAAADGDHDGSEALGWFYDTGKWVEQDKAKAAFHFRRAAEAGFKHSQWRLGVMLDRGEGVVADPEEAFRWLLKSAQQNYSRAFTSLGVMYALGRGTRQDFDVAMKTYRRAAELGEPHGFYGVGMLHARGEGVPENRIEALAWLVAASNLGDEDAQGPIDQLAGEMTEADVKRAMERANAIGREFGLLNPPPDTST